MTAKRNMCLLNIFASSGGLADLFASRERADATAGALNSNLTGRDRQLTTTAQIGLPSGNDIPQYARETSCPKPRPIFHTGLFRRCCCRSKTTSPLTKQAFASTYATSAQ